MVHNPDGGAREQRAQPRFTAQFRSTLAGHHVEAQGRTLDVSLGGCRIESPGSVSVGSAFECRLHIPGLDWPLMIDEATVRWAKGHTFGLSFVRMRPEERDKLRTVVQQLEDEP